MPLAALCCFATAGIVERAVDQAAAAVDLALAAQGDQLHRLDLARLEAHRGAGGQVEPHAVGRRAVEDQRRLTSKKWKCEPTCTGRSPVLLTCSVAVGRPAFSSSGAPSKRYSPGIMGNPRPRGRVRQWADAR